MNANHSKYNQESSNKPVICYLLSEEYHSSKSLQYGDEVMGEVIAHRKLRVKFCNFCPTRFE